MTIKVMVEVSVDAAIDHPSPTVSVGQHVIDVEISEWPDELRQELKKYTVNPNRAATPHSADVYLVKQGDGLIRKVFNAFHDISPAGVKKLVEDLVAASRKDQEARTEKEAVQAKNRADRDAAMDEQRRIAVKTLTGMGLHDLFDDATILNEDTGLYRLRYEHPYRVCTDGWPRRVHGEGVESLVPLIGVLQNMLDTRNEAIIAAKNADTLNWIAEHGSPLLKRMVEEDLLNEDRYQQERIAIERPGWCFCDRELDPATIELITAEDFALLNQARRLEPGAMLCWMRDHHVAMVPDYLGHTIVYHQLLEDENVVTVDASAGDAISSNYIEPARYDDGF